MIQPTRPSGDQQLVQILDAALADVTRRSGRWLVCGPGCTPCCVGVFAINQLDAARLCEGLSELDRRDSQRASSVRQRARESVARLKRDFPGDPATGVLNDSKRARRKFESFANDEACPALDPERGTCDLYAHRPMTCRVFGPPVRSANGLGVCELCYRGATDEEIADCEMEVDPADLESRLLSEIEHVTGKTGRTIVAFCLAQDA